jgi:Ala-tRNA(Pro) deacylase
MAIPTSVSNYLEQHGVSYRVIVHPVAYTAQEEAALTHVPGREWAKAVVCIVDNEPVLAVLPAHCHANLGQLQAALGASSARLANEEELSPLYADCEVGAMPPLGPLYGQRVVVDKSLASREEVVFNAGSHREAIRMRFSDFAQVVSPIVAEFAEVPRLH